jgi:hypothetical protein
MLAGVTVHSRAPGTDGPFRPACPSQAIQAAQRSSLIAAKSLTSPPTRFVA